MIGKGKNSRDNSSVIEDSVHLYSGRASAAERLEINRRLQDETAEKAFVEVNHLIAGLDEWAAELSSDPEVKAWLNETPELDRVSGARSYWPKLAVAAGLVLAVGVAILQPWQSALESTGNVLRYVTTVGEQKQIALDDGSVLTLNTASQVLVDMNDQARRIVLDRGEVYFDVAKDESRPFSVEVGGRNITVLGTAFNVHRTTEGFSLALVEGEVAMHRPGQGDFDLAPELDPQNGEEVQLKADGALRVQSGTYFEFRDLTQQLSARHDPGIAKRQAWRTGLLSFEGVPLGVVVQELNRYSAKPIRLVGDQLAGIEVYSTLNINNIKTALSGLEVSAQVVVTHHVDRIDISVK
ncbi:FecR domain-containing protein [Porticoccaceae bacterium LTM1]|nr:FecR domain-containing protein [Porticoccaceae bacterium LTM1]